MLSDDEIGKLINQLRDVAIQYRDTQQLRERIGYIVRAASAKASQQVQGFNMSIAAELRCIANTVEIADGETMDRQNALCYAANLIRAHADDLMKDGPLVPQASQQVQSIPETVSDEVGVQLYEEMRDAIHPYVDAGELPYSVIESWEIIFQHWLATKAMPTPKQEPVVIADGEYKPHEWWRVEVSLYDGMLVAIEPEVLAGKGDLTGRDEETIRAAGRHLLSFVGNPVPAQAAAIPEGWQLVPIEPTMSQFEAAINAYMLPGMFPASHYSPIEALRIEYAAMLSAAPKPEGEQ